MTGFDYKLQAVGPEIVGGLVVWPASEAPGVLELYRTLAESAPRLREAEADVRAVVLLAYYGRIEDEVVTTALRGFDPALYSGLDIICLVTDGIVKPLIQSPIGSLAART